MRWLLPAARRALIVLLSAASLAALQRLPAMAGFAIAVATATGWCIWLERHPAA